ncbi:Paf1-domain-containing protein [Tuber borchii]|uniref:Paf1-domain-containing protein n=1 Tax=Tuber borchii TaxID=42251 RepID=A0A2T6ZXT2_TUBBO|nr:Paf1-domain-containing protein [Tuber borchii]
MSQRSNRPHAQDYIARIRYNNSLPPPPCPPKMLNIPNSSLAMYCDPSFTSKLARAEGVNVEIDSELGMPLDLVHVPKIFDGDHSAILALDPVPPIDPKDRLLMRPAAALGKTNARATGSAGNVSFLRRTEYISAEQSRSTFKSGGNTERLMAASRAKRASRPEDNDPVRILQAVLKGFDVANPETAGQDHNGLGALAVGDIAAANAERNWKELKHPNKPGVRAVETYPLLPDFQATSDNGGYMVFKFMGSPVVPGEKRDTRLDVGLLKPKDKPLDDDGNPVGQDIFDYYIPASESIANRVKAKFAAYAEDEDEEDDKEDGDEFRYDFEAALLLNKSDDKKSKGAYFYPVLTRYTIRPRRKNKYPPGMPFRHDEESEDDGEKPPEVMNLKVRALNEVERQRHEDVKHRWDNKPEAGVEE